MPPTMLAPVPTRPRSNPYRRRRGAAPLLLDQAATAASAGKRPAESSTSASSCFYSEVISASSTSLAAYQRPEKRSRRQDEDEARPAGSECSVVIGGARALPAEVEASESSCLGSVLESDLACPEQLADDADTTEYSSAYEELTPSEPEEEEVLSGPCSCAEYSLSPLISSPLTNNDDAAAAPSATFSLFLDFANQFVPCVHPEARAVNNAALDLLTGKRFEDLDDEESYERFRRRERREAVARDYTEVYGSMPGSYGRLVVEQRVVMVNWINEISLHSHLTKLEPVTVFMGIGLMDRFLTQGYMKSLRNLQLLGIACITLATRLEENQPYN